MKTIFRVTSFGVLLAAFIAVGSIVGFAQDPCADADGQAALGDKFRELYPKTSVDDRKAAIDTGQQFLDKYGKCDSAKELSDYLNTNLPKMKARLDAIVNAGIKNALIAKFNTAFKARNWDDFYSAGKDLLDKYPDEFRDVELALASVGLDETAKTPPVTKWNDDTLRFAKQSIQDLEGGKTFKTYGISIKDGPNFQYKNKDDALGWMNYTIGYIYFYDKKDKKTAVSYLYKASEFNSDTKTNPVVYQIIGAYYYDDVKRLLDEVKALIALQDPKDTPEVAQQKVDAIKAKAAVLNGTTERSMDAYSRAYSLVPATDKTKAAYRDDLRKTLGALYLVRFKKSDGLDSWIAGVAGKQLPDPMSPIVPIPDPEPAAPATTTTTTTTTVKPPTTTPVKTPATPPAKGQGSVAVKQPSR